MAAFNLGAGLQHVDGGIHTFSAHTEARAGGTTLSSLVMGILSRR